MVGHNTIFELNSDFIFLLLAKKYQQLFPKDKKKPAAQDQQQKSKPAQPKAEPKPAPPPASEEEEDTPKPSKSDPYADLPPRYTHSYKK